jgi:hypothetical protein
MEPAYPHLIGMLRAHQRPLLCTFRITNLKLNFYVTTNVRLEPYVYLITHYRYV